MSDNIEIIETVETAEELAARTNRLRAAEIARRFKEIDAERIRPLSAVALGTAAIHDSEKLATLEDEAIALRAELSQIGE